MYVQIRRDTTAGTTVLLCLALLMQWTPRGAGAQDTTRDVRTDSLAERLRRAEAAIELLREQLATEAASGVHSASRVRVDIFGRVLMNGFSNSARVNNADVPLFAVRDSGDGGLGATVRQTSFGIAVAVSHVLGGRFDGELHTDFFGGQQPSSGGRRFPLLRIRTARGILRWSRGEVLFGQEVPLVAGVNPNSVAAFGTPEFVTAGNLWLWLPQVRGTWVLHRASGLALQGAVLAPTSGDAVGQFDTDLDPAERSRRPYLQGRLRIRWGKEDQKGEIGAGIHRGWIRRDDGTLVVSDAVAADAVIPLGTFEFRGEVYGGQALRGLGGGGIGQNLTTTGGAVRDRGGWGQLEFSPDTRWSLGSGCGAADPRDDADLPAGRRRNEACEAHVTVHPDGPIVVSLAWRQHRTTYASGQVTNTHFNLALGFEF